VLTKLGWLITWEHQLLIGLGMLGCHKGATVPIGQDHPFPQGLLDKNLQYTNTHPSSSCRLWKWRQQNISKIYTSTEIKDPRVKINVKLCFFLLTVTYRLSGLQSCSAKLRWPMCWWLPWNNRQHFIST
jgi:hypothetical protein